MSNRYNSLPVPVETSDVTCLQVARPAPKLVLWQLCFMTNDEKSPFQAISLAIIRRNTYTNITVNALCQK